MNECVARYTRRDDVIRGMESNRYSNVENTQLVQQCGVQ